MSARGWDVRRLGVLGVLVVTALALRIADANPARSQAATLRAWRVDRVAGLDPADPLWSDVAPISVPLTAQQGIYSSGGGSIPTVDVRAVHDGARLFVRIEWTDGTRDVSNRDAIDFADAAAVQFPAAPGSTVPAVCMGQADAGVNIWQWRADRQPGGAGRGPVVDYYPSQDDLWFPARDAGNPNAVAAPNPVHNLVARSFGTIGPAVEQPVVGRASYAGDAWSVVFARSFESPGPDQPAFAVGQRSDVAFAIWDGTNGDRDGQKQVSQFVQLSMAAAGPPAGAGLVWLPTAVAFAVVIPILVLLVRGAGRGR